VAASGTVAVGSPCLTGGMETRRERLPPPGAEQGREVAA